MRGPRSRSTSVCFLISILLLLPALALSAAESGEWTLSRTGLPGKVQFSLQGSRGDGHYFNSSSDWNTADFRGLDWSATGKHDVRFTIIRDAGTFTCEGFVKEGAGAGIFTFEENPQYASQMAMLGFPLSSEHRQMTFAIHDISLAFARQMKSAGVTNLDTDKLIAFKIHGVTSQFIGDLRSQGLTATDANKLIAFRIHGVSPDYVRDLARLGYSHPPADELIALRIHGVTPDYIENLKAHGVRNITLRQLIALRIHGID